LEAAAAMGAFMLVLGWAGWHRGTPLSADDVLYREATTACLTAIVLMQVVNVHLCRSRRKSIFTSPFLGNRLITAGIVAELVFIVLIDYTAAGHTFFGTAPIGLVSWGMILPFAAGMLILEELRKVIVRRTQVTG
jgi:sodium/potassium-transporting ATPase subunit alpha